MVQPGAVTIGVPAEYSSLRVLRLAVASVAADLAFDIEEVESARSAVDELASMLIGVTDAARNLDIVIRRDADHLAVTGRVDATRDLTPPGSIVSAVLDASTTTWTCRSSRHEASFEFKCVRGRVGAPSLARDR